MRMSATSTLTTSEDTENLSSSTAQNSGSDIPARRYRPALEALYGALGGSVGVGRLVGFNYRSANCWKLGDRPLPEHVAARLAEEAARVASTLTALSYELRTVDIPAARYRAQRKRAHLRELFRARFGRYPDGPHAPGDPRGRRPRGGP